jgi:thiol-disulfide isomerase/thioredoxin
MKKQVFILLSLIISLSVFSQGIEFQQGTWKDVLKKAQELNKPIFVDIYTTWCGPCKRMSADIFPLKEVGDVYNQRFVCFKIDAEKGEGIVLAKKYDVKFYPTYLFINPDESLIMKAIGSMPADEFIALTDKVKAELSDTKTLADWNNEYELKKSDPVFLLAYMEKRMKIGLPNAAILDQYLSVLPSSERATEKILEFYQIESRDIKVNSLAYKNLDDNEAQIVAKTGNLIHILRSYIIDNSFREACKMKDENILKVVVAENNKLPKSVNSKSEEEFYMYYYKKINDIQNYTTFANSFCSKMMLITKDSVLKMDKKSQSKYSQSLNEAAWTYFEKVTDANALKNAVNWSKRTVELQPDNFSYLDTYANLLFKTGNKNKAIEQQTLAISLAQKSNEDTKELEETLQKMKSGLKNKK